MSGIGSSVFTQQKREAGSGGTVTGGANGLRNQGTEIYLGGTLLEATNIEMDNFVFNFVNALNSQLYINPDNEYGFGDIDGATNQTFFKIDNNAQTVNTSSGGGKTSFFDAALGVYQLGDIDGTLGNHTFLEVDDFNQEFTIWTGAGSQMLSMSHLATYLIGDIDGAGNGTRMEVDAGNDTIQLGNNTNVGLDINFLNRIYTLGDFSAADNGTKIEVDDDNLKIVLTAPFGEIRLYDNSLGGAAVGYVWALKDTGTGEGEYKDNLAALTNCFNAGGLIAGTVFYSIGGGGATGSANEVSRQTVLPFAGTLKNLYYRFLRPSSGTGSITVTLRINSVATALTVTDSTNNGTFATLTATTDVSFNAGDRVSLEVVCTYSAFDAVQYSVAAKFY